MSLIVDIKKKFKGFDLNVSFETNNEYLGILGASGSGKSMTLKCIAGIETPDEGRIVLNDKVLFDSQKKINLKPQERNVGYLFQNYALFPNMTVEENISLGLKLPKAEKNKMVLDMISTFHLQGLEKKYPIQLSGGQQQRVALARSIAYSPDVLLLDEPFSALDTHLREQVQDEVFELMKIYKGDVLMVTHSMDEAYRFCKNLMIIENGKSILTDNTKEIFKSPSYVSVARLIGCDNISSCIKLSTNKAYALDWDLEIKFNTQVDDYKYIGINSNSFEVVENNYSEINIEEINIIECEIIDVIEKLTGYTIIFKNKNTNKNTSVLYFDVNKDYWNDKIDQNKLYLKIKETEILLLK